MFMKKNYSWHPSLHSEVVKSMDSTPHLMDEAHSYYFLYELGYLLNISNPQCPHLGAGDILLHQVIVRTALQTCKILQTG